MANWNNPALTSLYVDFLADLKARDVDVAVMSFAGSATNIPLNTIRFERTLNVFQEWLGAGPGWQNKILGAAGGGTGSSAPISLGTMATQNANAVAITGGTITGVGLNGSDITSGIVALNRGGTGASLALGANGQFLQSNGAAVVFGVNGAALNNLNASNVNAGNLPMAQMPLNGTWLLNAPSAMNINGQYFQMHTGGVIIGGPAGGNMGANTLNAQAIYINGVPIATGAGVPSGLMAYFSGACPAGWTFVAASHERMVRSWNGGNGFQHGSIQHNHGFSVPAGGGGDINSGIAHGEISGSGAPSGRDVGMDSGSGVTGWLAFSGGGGQHTHTIGHDHTFFVPGFPGHNGTSDLGGDWPPAIDFTLCSKN